jgi:hypothetical protein
VAPGERGHVERITAHIQNNGLCLARAEADGRQGRCGAEGQGGQLGGRTNLHLRKVKKHQKLSPREISPPYLADGIDKHIVDISKDFVWKVMVQLQA